MDNIQDEIDAIGDLVSIIERLLNLDLNRETRESIQALLDAMTSEISAQDLPDDIRESLIEAQNDIGTASNNYYDAQERYNNATTDEEKEEAQKDMDTAKDQMKEAQSNLNEAEKERKKYIKELQELLKKAIIELYRDGKDKESELLAQFEELKENETTTEKEFFVFDVEETSTPSDVVVPETLKKINKIELEYGSYLFSKLLNSSDVESDVFKSFLEKAKTKGTNILSYVKQLKEDGVRDNEIVVSLKEKLNELFTTILIEENYNNYN